MILTGETGSNRGRNLF